MPSEQPELAIETERWGTKHKEDRETEMLAALANLRDQLAKLQKRVERLESEERRQRACAAM